jgi:hypothetical protein
MVRPIRKSLRIALFAVFVVFVAFLVIAFDSILIAPIHEFGHFLAASISGIKVVKVEWNQIQTVPVSDWRQYFFGCMGGFFAALFLSPVYLILKSILPEIRSPRLYAFAFFFFIIVMTDIIVQTSVGILEGAFGAFYEVFVKSIVGPIIWSVIVSSFSLFWNRKNSRFLGLA